MERRIWRRAINVVVVSTLLALSIPIFPPSAVYAAEGSFYFNSYSSSDFTNPANMVDSVETSYAASNGNSNNATLDGNSNPGTDLGAITKVELSVYAYSDASGDDTLDFTPYATPYQVIPGTGAAWNYMDITSDPNIPGGTWDWTDIAAMTCVVDYAKAGGPNTMYVGWVGIRVTYTGDTAPPTVNTYSPANGATGIAVNTNLVLTFDENVQAGSGYITIYKYSDDSLVESMDITSENITISNDTVTINPNSDLANGTKYYVMVPSGVITDQAAPVPNAYAGIASKDTWEFTNVTADHTITATFAADIFTLTYTAGEHGSIDGSSPQTIDYGADGITVTAVPDDGYRFVDWSDGTTDNPRTPTGVTADISVIANFAVDNGTYTIPVTQSTNGTITPDTTTVEYGASQAFTITPDPGYRIVEIIVDGVSQGVQPSWEFTNVTADHAITATFAADIFTLTYTAGEHGSIDGSSPQTIDYGADGITVTAVPDDGYRFVDWSDGATDNPRTDTGVTADISVIANFAADNGTYTITVTQSTNGTITPDTTTVEYSASQAFTIVPDAGYHIVDVIVDDVSQGAQTTLAFDNVTAEHAVTATFAADNKKEALIIRLLPNLNPNAQQQLITRHGGEVIRSIPPLRMHVIKVPAVAVDAVMKRYQSDEEVLSVERDKVRQVDGTPSDTSYQDQWALPQISWDSVFGSVTPSGTSVIAILDTGIDASQPDLSGLVLPGYSVFEGADAQTDPHGHGTRVAGIAGALTDNGDGIAGVAYAGVSILPVQVLGADGTGQDSDIIDGIIWATDNGADVILMAFSNPGYSEALQAAIDYAWDSGVILVAAAGNNGSDVVTYPAGDRGVIGVSATDQNDALATSSNYGESIFLAAPGVDIATTDTDGVYTIITGTSASAAIVAGAAAFMRAVDPSLTNGVIVNRMASTADPAGTQNQTGNGRINMARALGDTSMDFIQPAGVPPLGDGGPYIGPYTAAAIVTISASTSWSVITGGSGPGGLPDATDTVEVVNNAILTIDVSNAVCAALNIGASGKTGTVVFNSGSQLTVSGSVTSIGNKQNAITMTSGGTLITGSFTDSNPTLVLTFTPGTGTVKLTGANTLPATFPTSFNNLTISGGTTSVNNNINISGTFSVGTGGGFSPGAAAVINSAGAAGTITGSGSVTVSRTAATADYSSQYKFTTNTLDNLTVIYGGAAAQTISALTYGNLKINNSIGVTLAGDTTVNDTLILTSGNVTTSTNTLIMGTSGLVSGGSSTSYVIGNLQQYISTGDGFTRTFQVGANNYNPVVFTFNSVTTAGNLTANVTSNQHDNIGSSDISPTKNVEVYWVFLNSGIIADSADMTFNFASGDVIGSANTSNFIVGKYSSGGWIHPTIGTKTSTSTQALEVPGSVTQEFVVGETTAPTVTSITPSSGFNTGSV
ncbi:S8 family serine peptidase, partial [Chloroflexota bacterium]